MIDSKNYDVVKISQDMQTALINLGLYILSESPEKVNDYIKSIDSFADEIEKLMKPEEEK